MATGGQSAQVSPTVLSGATGAAQSFGSNAARAAAVTSPSTTFPDGTRLTWGSRGALVEQLQRMLTAAGFSVQVTGNYYTLTTEAVRRYQQANGLAVDGVAGPQTLSRLSGRTVGSAPASGSSGGSSSSSGASSSSSASTTLTGNPALRVGSRGAQVELLQERLNRYGAAIREDGDFGSVTDRAVRAFQAANGLTVDGIVGVYTARKLNSETARSVSSSSSSASNSSSSTDDAYAQRAAMAISAARAQIGVPYKFYTATPGVNFDCSGLTLYAWGVAGVRLSHHSATQAGQTRDVTNETWLPGDLLFFHSPISHVSIYLGNGQHIHAPQEGENVKIGSFTRSNVVKVGRPRI